MDDSQLSFLWVISVVLLPLVLIMSATLSPFLFAPQSRAYIVLSFLGHPFVALTLTTVFAMLVANS